MHIECVANTGESLPVDCLDPNSGFHRETTFWLNIGKVYVVYGITLYMGHVWYYIWDEADTYYPTWNPSPLFRVADGQLSKYWIYGYAGGKTRDETEVIFAFKEWVEDPYFYDKLTDGEEKEVSIFRRYKDLMDVEFQNPSITKKATLVEDGQMLCPDCSRAWQSSSQDGMLICPGCSAFLRNPLFRAAESQGTIKGKFNL